MNLKVKTELQDKANLEVVPFLQIACHKCGSDNWNEIGLTKAGTQRYYCKSCKAKFVRVPNNKKLIRSDDVWLAEDLGLLIHPHRKSHGTKFNFQHIRQDWLKAIIKRYIKYKASSGLSFDSLNEDLNCCNNFSLFLTLTSHVNQIEDIDRSIVISYLEYISQQGWNPKGQCRRITALSCLLEAGNANKWFEVKPYLIHKEDYPRQSKALPRYIPDDVIRQLNQHLAALPEPIIRMVLVIQECGLRIGELCQLPLDCLKQDSKGGWFIQFMRWKMKFETTLPISIELAQVIKTQQQYIQEYLHGYQYLFCANSQGGQERFTPQPKVIDSKSFINYIKRLADEFNICDSTGKVWNFQTHQFRHTAATSWINNGVPQHIVQRMLGHDSPQMTAVYAHVHDATLRKELDKYLGTKIVNVNGEVIESITPILDNDSELQWMSRKVSSETLSNGYCGLPAQLTCNKGNACLTCSDFRTTIEYLDQHKQHLERTNQVLEVAQANGWERQIQINLDVKNSLEKIITTLEANQDG